MQPEELSEFFNKYAANRHSEAEHQAFLAWLYTLPEHQVKDVLEMYQHVAQGALQVPDPRLIQKIESRLDAQQVYHIKPRVLGNTPLVRLLAIAACFIMMVAAAAYFLLNRPSGGPVMVKNQLQKHNILQGGNKAILRLANGAKIVLDSVKAGEIARQSGAAIVKTNDGKVIFDASATKDKTSGSLAWNMLFTPRGGQYVIKLPDGSNVWLNSASSLKFPTVFEGNERVVELTGEAYFEVAKNPSMPFRVKTAQQLVEVLGTHFNVNCYDDEPAVVTTLLEGSVKIVQNTTRQTMVLKPGQQARLSGSLHKVSVDTTLFVDWKEGYFKFTHEDIHSIMRRAARWYNVDVSYSGNITTEGFVGIVPRSKDIYGLLNVLKLTGLVNYKIEGRHVTIMP